MGELIKLENDTVIIAQCPECDGEDWWLLVDDEGDSFSFQGVMCSNCGYEIDLRVED